MTNPAGESTLRTDDVPGRWPRRRVLAVGGAGLVGAGLVGTGLVGTGLVGTATPAHAATGFAALRERAAELHLGPPVDTTVEPFRTALQSLVTRAADFAGSYAPAPGRLWP